MNTDFSKRWKTFLYLGMGFFMMGVLLAVGQIRLKQEALASRIAPAVLRFHILADSDSAADQEVKLEIRSLILDYMQEMMKNEGENVGDSAVMETVDVKSKDKENDNRENADRKNADEISSERTGAGGTNADGISSERTGADKINSDETSVAKKEKTRTALWVKVHADELTALADRHLAANGLPYRSRLQVLNTYFPARTYGAYRFPCGYYDAVRITLGSGRGHNWWCVLYPRFCFVDAVCSEVPEESEEKLRRTLDQGDFLALKERRPELKIEFKLLSLFRDRR